MSEKQYYRLSELSTHYDISPDEIRYQVEQEKLRLSFLLPSTAIVFGRYPGSGFQAIGFGTFKGIVTVTSEISVKLFQCEKVKASSVVIRSAKPFISFSWVNPQSPYQSFSHC